MKWVLINRCYGVAELSQFGRELLGVEFLDDLKRDDIQLINAFMEHGCKIASSHSKFEIVCIDDDTEFHIFDYDGLESIVSGNNLKIYK